MTIKAINQGIPTDSVNLIFDTIIAVFTALVDDLLTPFMIDVGAKLFFIFLELAPAVGFMLLISLFLYMFHLKYIGPIRG